MAIEWQVPGFNAQVADPMSRYAVLPNDDIVIAVTQGKATQWSWVAFTHSQPVRELDSDYPFATREEAMFAAELWYGKEDA